MIDPRQVFVAIPTYSGRIVAEAMGSLIHCTRYFAQISLTVGVSHVALARNFIAAKFLASGLEWLVTIDDDIAFVPSDFETLLEPFIPDGRERMSAADAIDLGIENTPTRVKTREKLSGRDHSGASEPYYDWRDADAIVCAEYSFKDDSLTPCRQGLGFTRIHRSVFEAIENLKHADGAARTWQFVKDGRLLTDFYPCGALLAQILPSAPWTGEDHGFFLLAKLAGFTPRIETRTKLFHVGTKAYPYAPGDSIQFDAGGAQ